MNSEINTLSLDAEYSSIILKQVVLVGSLIINKSNANIQVVDNGEIKTVRINKENTNLSFAEDPSNTTFYLNSNNINITCPNIWVTSGEFIV